MDVVDAQAGQCRHQVLDGRHTCLALLKHGGHTRIADHCRLRRKIDDFGQINPVKHDARIGCRRTQGEFDPATGMQADTSGTNQILYAALTKHGGNRLCETGRNAGNRHLPTH